MNIYLIILIILLIAGSLRTIMIYKILGDKPYKILIVSSILMILLLLAVKKGI